MNDEDKWKQITDDMVKSLKERECKTHTGVRASKNLQEFINTCNEASRQSLKIVEETPRTTSEDVYEAYKLIEVLTEILGEVRSINRKLKKKVKK